MKSYNRLPTLLILLIFLITTAAGLRAEIIRQALSGTMPAGRDVSEWVNFQITPDGQYALFVADIDSDETFDLYSIPVDGNEAPTRLSNVLNSTTVYEFATGPGNMVVYRAQEDNIGVIELYRTKVDGTEPIEKVNPVFEDGGIVQLDRDVAMFQISPDGSYIVYLADQDTNEVFELYSVATTGNIVSHLPLNDTLVAGGDVEEFQITLDSNRIIYRADQDTNDKSELYSVPITGGKIAKLNPPLAADRDVIQFDLIDNDVIYHADQDIDQTFELHHVRATGGTSTKLNPPLAGGRTVVDFKVHAGSHYVVYRADQDTDEVWELYSVALPSGDVSKLNAPLPSEGDVDGNYQITPNGNHVVYRADQDITDVVELYVTSIAGGIPGKLNKPLAADKHVIDFVLSPDSNRVVYRADQDILKVYELYSVPLLSLGGHKAIKLNGDLVADGNVLSNYRISPDGSRVLYLADALVANQADLFSVPLLGGNTQRVNAPLVADGNVTYFKIVPDGSRVLYRADQNVDEQFELFAVSETPSAIQFSSASLTAPESAAAVELTVMLSDASFAETGVKYSVAGGTATNGADFDLAAGVLTFPPGSTSQTISVPITDDALDEADETIIISLSASQNASLGTNDTTIITIIDDDENDDGGGDDGYTVYLPVVIR